MLTRKLMHCCVEFVCHILIYLQASEENKTAMMLKLGKLQSQVFEKKQELQNLKEISSTQAQEMKNCVSNKQAFFKRAATIDKATILKEQVLYELVSTV